MSSAHDKSPRAAPKLSVAMITFNHGEFLSQALDSVLTQRVSFDYDIIIGDDCSNDATCGIITSYQRQFPEKIKPIFRKVNVGMGRNFVETLQACGGEYTALLEGDDYWTADDKLQKQVEYLEEFKDCAICHHKVRHVLSPSGKIIREYPRKRYRVQRLESPELAKSNFIQTCSVMFRRAWLPRFDEQYEQLKLGDWPLFTLLTQSGWIGYIENCMADYRIHPSNSWNNRPASYKVEAMKNMAFYLLERVDLRCKDAWMDTILALDFKDLVLSARSLSVRKTVTNFKTFVLNSAYFHKPFWIFRNLVPYYRANYGED